MTHAGSMAKIKSVIKSVELFAICEPCALTDFFFTILRMRDEGRWSLEI